MKVPVLDLAATHAAIRDELAGALMRVLDGGQYVLGPELEAFERELAEYVEAEHAIGVGSGLDALVLALRAVGVLPGDEVIVPANTFIATFLAVSQLGARPVPVEPESGTWGLDVAAARRALTTKTRAIVPVHLFGQPCDLDPLLELGREHGVAVVEDAAQAHGARYRGRRIGGHGDAVCFSFYPAKNLGALGDAGAVTTRAAAIAERVRLLRNYGSPKKYEHVLKGQNSRLDEIQAAALRVKLRHLDRWNGRRREVAARYLTGLCGAPGFTLPGCLPETEPVWHLFVVDHPERDRLRDFLAARGVGTLVHYPVPAHQCPAYSELGLDPGSLPLTEGACRTHVSLPIGPHLSDAAVEHVIASAWAFARGDQ
ncbi:MAG: DegT/DnrJ/EryC1/StrS family aminotransferase [Polyangiaceae bacterium]|nr:DegT/DnrJ/EryC1/StrS family aminotransferase [Polyangiaceae bacterium]